MSLHGTRYTYNQGCRCARCREANRAYAEKRRRDAGVQPLKAGPQADHGSPSRYQRHRCRCAACRAGQAARMKSFRAARAQRLAEAPHGTTTGYFGWGCRCDACGAAGSAANREYRASLRARRAS